MKKIFLTVACIALIKLSQAQAPNFSGNWKVDLEHSVFGVQPKSYAAASIKISQDQDVVALERTIIDKDTARSIEKLKFDGSSTENMVSGGRKKIASIQWTTDKKALVETAQYSYVDSAGKPGQFKSIENFTLADDKKTLIYTREVISDKMNFQIKAVYDRVQ